MDVDGILSQRLSGSARAMFQLVGDTDDWASQVCFADPDQWTRYGVAWVWRAEERWSEAQLDRWVSTGVR